MIGLNTINQMKGEKTKKIRMNDVKKLDDLARKWLTDKSDAIGSNGHGYAKKYEEIFNKWRLNYVNLLEIGVATGASIGMWHEYFENGKIYCFDDVDRPSYETILSELLKTNQVFFEMGNQENKNDLINMCKKFNINNFDIIIDDGSHQPNHQMITFGLLFSYLKSNGYYIIEDVAVPENTKIINSPNNIETYNTILDFKNTGVFNTKYLTEDEINYLKNNILSIEIYNSIKPSHEPAYGKWGTIIIEKK